ncbi:glycosyltransferase [Streptomyces sp. NPDC059816]|uniref:glycosyltransferase n=1 Tax=Streptomyces sp. NPDC059816 TaxID=3346960 RepID=UPI003660271C
MDLRDPQHAQVSVVVIGHDDAPHITGAVRSALAQGPVVREVLAVDDGSTDGSPDLLDALAAREPRLRVLRRTDNSGGCGTPRNDGLAAASAPYALFLDSDDLLPPRAAALLLAAAREQRAEVAAGLCVRRELPHGPDRPWQPRLYAPPAAPAVLGHPSERPELTRDTLCVNKLYRTDFLRAHDVRFPEGRFPYEDFVFTARVLAAGPRLALIPDPVYVWQVRRDADRLSISLDRAGIDNWRARTDAHRAAVDVLLTAGEHALARASRAAFLDLGLRMYARELDRRTPEYRRQWWAHTRSYLGTFDPDDLNPVDRPGRLLAGVLLAAPQPQDLPRLRELASRPARLLPPHARGQDATPLWSNELPVPLDRLAARPLRTLPLTVSARLRPRLRGTTLRLRLHEFYGRVAQAEPVRAEAEFVERRTGRVGARCPARFRSAPDGTPPDDRTWTAEATVPLRRLGAGTWDLRVLLRFADGTERLTSAHATDGPGLLRRRALPSAGRGVRLVQPYATHSGSLALRIALGPRGAFGVFRRRLVRLLGSRRRP